MDGDDEKWLVEGGERVEEPNEEEEDNSLASNSSDSSFVESSMESSSRVEVEDVTDEDCAERRFQVCSRRTLRQGPYLDLMSTFFCIQTMEDGAAVKGDKDVVDSSPIGTGSGIEEAFTAREDEEFCEVSPLMREKGGVMYAPDRPPPLWDFLTVVTAFFVAVGFAYYTISVVEA